MLSYIMIVSLATATFAYHCGKIDEFGDNECTIDKPLCAVKLSRKPAIPRCVSPSLYCNDPFYEYVAADEDDRFYSFEKWNISFVIRLET